jgi:hypothetical protein
MFAWPVTHMETARGKKRTTWSVQVSNRCKLTEKALDEIRDRMHECGLEEIRDSLLAQVARLAAESMETRRFAVREAHAHHSEIIPDLTPEHIAAIERNNPLLPPG